MPRNCPIYTSAWNLEALSSNAAATFTLARCLSVRDNDAMNA
jgi:hypothetical protein